MSSQVVAPPAVSDTVRRKRRAWIALWLLILVACTAFLVWIGSRTQIDNWDAFESLNNAALIGGWTVQPLQIYRSPLPYLILVPHVLLENWTGRDGLGFRLAHIAAPWTYVLFVVSTFLVCRGSASLRAAVVASAVVALSPVALHYGWTVKEDLLCGGLLALAIHLYLRSRRTFSIRGGVLAGLVLGLAATARYNALALAPVLLIAFEIIDLTSRVARKHVRQRWPWKRYLGWFASGVASCGLTIWFATVLAFVPVGRDPWWQAPLFYVEDLRRIRDVFHIYVVDPPQENVRVLGILLTWPGAVIAALTLFFVMLRPLRRRTGLPPALLMHLLWVCGFFAFSTFAIATKEVRYHFIFLPGLCVFLAIGLDAITGRLRRHVRYPWPIVAGVLLIWAATAVPRVIARLLDPVYRSSFPREVADAVNAVAQPREPVYWIGAMLAMHPRDYVLHPAEQFACIYHFDSHVVAFWSRRPVVIGERQTFADVRDGESLLHARPTLLRDVQAGGLLIASPGEPALTSTITSLPLKLYLERVTTRSHRLLPNQAGGMPSYLPEGETAAKPLQLITAAPAEHSGLKRTPVAVALLWRRGTADYFPAILYDDHLLHVTMPDRIKETPVAILVGRSERLRTLVWTPTATAPPSQ